MDPDAAHLRASDTMLVTQIESLFPIRSYKQYGLGDHKNCGACAPTRAEILVIYVLSDFLFAHFATTPLPLLPLKKLRVAEATDELRTEACAQNAI